MNLPGFISVHLRAIKKQSLAAAEGLQYQKLNYYFFIVFAVMIFSLFRTCKI